MRHATMWADRTRAVLEESRWDGQSPPDAAPGWLVALTAQGPTVIASPRTPAAAHLPADRLSLGPATLGGMVVSGPPECLRMVLADDDGAMAVVVASGDQLVEEAVTTDDVDAVALLWRLQDPGVTRTTADELLARLLLWACLNNPPHGTAPNLAMEAAVASVAAGDLAGLADLLGVGVPMAPDAADVREVAAVLGHPSLSWDDIACVHDELDRLDYLNACVPTRWLLADELRTLDHRPDLADAVMGAPTPGRGRAPVA